MSTLEKLREKFNEKPIPNDISFDEVERLAKSYGCAVVSGGKHSKKIVDVPSGTVIPIPAVPVEASQEYSGKLTVRIAPAVHRDAAQRAKAERVSLTQYISDAIVNWNAHNAPA